MITLRVTKHENWGTEPLKEAFCPECGVSIIDFDKKKLKCWYCKHELQKTVRYFFEKKVARWVYYTRLKEQLEKC